MKGETKKSNPPDVKTNARFRFSCYLYSMVRYRRTDDEWKKSYTRDKGALGSTDPC